MLARRGAERAPFRGAQRAYRVLQPRDARHKETELTLPALKAVRTELNRVAALCQCGVRRVQSSDALEEVSRARSVETICVSIDTVFKRRHSRAGGFLVLFQTLSYAVRNSTVLCAGVLERADTCQLIVHVRA